MLALSSAGHLCYAAIVSNLSTLVIGTLARHRMWNARDPCIQRLKHSRSTFPYSSLDAPAL